ncbi:MAG: SpoIIE family protein phosphatase [Acidobacteriia bacterium]|nr:SpoIIE family protein phosphatase [Terriglobia bacterium]
MTGPRVYYTDFSGGKLVVPISQSVLKIGRNSENHVILNDPSISRFHAEIRPQNGSFYIVDVGSKNGTIVNGERVTERKLAHGDRIQLGSNPAQAVLFALEEVKDSVLASISSTNDSAESKVSSHHLRMLLEVSKALSSSLILDDVLNRVMEAVIELAGADRGFLMLKDAHGELQVAMSRNITREALEDKQHRLSRTVIQRVIQTDQSVIVCDAERDQHLRDQKSVIALNLKTIMCVPLRIYRSTFQDNGAEDAPAVSTIGLLYVDKQTVTQVFSDQDLELFETLAGHAAIAIENARLHQEELEKRQLEEEFKIAREIQQTLLPKTPPELARTRFSGVNIQCRAIGGDYYDFIPLGEDQVGIVIADVAGKGCSAALLTSMAQGMFLSEACPERSAAETISRVNHHLAQKNPSGKFVTAFYGVLTDAGEFRYCNAGHNPPLLVTAAGEVRPLREGGMVMGIFDKVPYEQGVVSWNSGDRLVFFTDGVTEAQSKTLEEFGDERLLELIMTNRTLSAEEMKVKIMDRLTDFTSGVLQHDDITLIVAERK